MQGIIYTRVSSDEQVKGTSLQSQEDLCRRYCAERQIEVTAVFREEGESAKSADRTELLRALEYCRQHKPKLSVFVVAKVDRFARNTEDHFTVRKLLLDYGVALHSVTEPIGNSPTEKFVETVLAASSEFDNAVRRQRCTDGMAAKLQQGLWPWRSPLGYQCLHFKSRGEKRTEPDPPHPEIFPILQRGLREYAKGRVSTQGELAHSLDSWGLAALVGKPTRPQMIDRILGKYLWFYAGLLPNPWTGERHRGAHVPMITKEELGRIQLIRSGKKGATAKRDRLNPLFPLRRTVTCASCGRPYTGSVSRGNGGRYAYYHCSNPSCFLRGKSVRKEILEEAFLHRVERLAPSAKALRVFRVALLDLWNKRESDGIEQARRAKKAVTDLESRRTRIFESHEAGAYTRDVFQERLAAVDRLIAEARTAVPAAEGAQQDDAPRVAETLPNALEAVNAPRAFWHALVPEMRLRFQQLIFPAGIPYGHEWGFGTAELGVFYTVLQRCTSSGSGEVNRRGINWNQLTEELKEWSEVLGRHQEEQKAA